MLEDRKLPTSASCTPDYYKRSDTEMDASILKIKQSYPSVKLLVDTKLEKFPQKVRKINVNKTYDYLKH